jgi:hypothetical protein
MNVVRSLGSLAAGMIALGACASTVDSGGRASSAGAGGAAGASPCPEAAPADSTPCPEVGQVCPFDVHAGCAVTHRVLTCGVEGWESAETAYDECCPAAPPSLGYACMLGGADGGPEVCIYSVGPTCGTKMDVSYTCVDGQWTVLPAPTPPC